jgi:hypothetical protein
MNIQKWLVAVSFVSLIGCAPSEPPAEPPVEADMAVTSGQNPFEQQVQEYIQKFPYQDTYNYAVKYTGNDPANLNVWVLGSEPVLVKAGEDKVVRMNNDTYYKMAFVDLRNGPVVLGSSAPSTDRFSSFQLMDDRNVNYQNVIHPDGVYTLYSGNAPEAAEGALIEVPSALSVVIVRVEVKNKDDETDTSAAKEVFKGITISGPQSADFPGVEALSYTQEVVDEGNKRLDEAFANTPFRLTVVGPDQELGTEVPYLNHSAGTKGGWGGPGTSHSSYETLFFDGNGEAFDGSKGNYTVITEPPQVDAFWSLTVYDTERGGFLHPNKDDRYHINNTTAVSNDDDTVTFNFKTSCADADLNCLEVPAGEFDVVARYYLPGKKIQSGEWELPKIGLVQ